MARRPPASGRLSAEARLRGLAGHVSACGPGDRNDPLFWAACRGAEMVAACDADAGTVTEVLVAAALEAGLRGGEAEARRTIASAMRGGER